MMCMGEPEEEAAASRSDEERQRQLSHLSMICCKSAKFQLSAEFHRNRRTPRQLRWTERQTKRGGRRGKAELNQDTFLSM